METIELKDLKIHELSSSRPDVKVVSFDGKITNSNSYELNRRFLQIFEDGVYNIVIDLSKLDYVNSTGVAIIFTLFYKAAEKEGRVCIGGLHPFLKKVFFLTQLPEGLSVYPDIESALASY
jgi:anti-anti-sigma factor